MLNNSLFSSIKQDWCTPLDLYNKLNEEFNFKVDVAANKNNAKCSLYLTENDNALNCSWDFNGNVFCNPPYKYVNLFFEKAYYESLKTNNKIVLLIPARTDTIYFHKYIYNIAEIRFLKGRIKFTDIYGNTKGSAPFPSMIVIYN